MSSARRDLLVVNQSSHLLNVLTFSPLDQKKIRIKSAITFYMQKEQNSPSFTN